MPWDDKDLKDITITHLGEQWILISDIDDNYYGTSALFEDIALPFANKSEPEEKK